MSVYDVIVMFFMEDIGSLYVVDEDFLVGFVFRKDLLKGVFVDVDIKVMLIVIIMMWMLNFVIVMKNDIVLYVVE